MTARDGGSSNSGVLRPARADARDARAKRDVERPNFRWVLNADARERRARARTTRGVERRRDDDDDDDD